MKERLSDVLAWFGFGFVVFTYSMWGLYEFSADIGVYMTELGTMKFLGFTPREYTYGTAHNRIWVVYIGCTVANYIAVGRPRLLPFQVDMDRFVSWIRK